jgi:hypothetical protein
LADILGDMRRTHHCNALCARDMGKEVILMGWVLRRRDHGGVIFIDLRDRDGITQVVFNPEVAIRRPTPRLNRHPERVRVGRLRSRAAPTRRHGQPQAPHRGDRGHGLDEFKILNTGLDPAVSWSRTAWRFLKRPG